MTEIGLYNNCCSVTQLNATPPALKARREPDGLGSEVTYRLRSLDVINRGAGSYGVLSTDIQINGCSLEVLQPQGPSGPPGELLVVLHSSEVKCLLKWLLSVLYIQFTYDLRMTCH
jgi:hypothetical protein